MTTHLLNGNPSNLRYVDDAPVFSQSHHRCPTWLPPTAQRLWKKLAPELSDKGLLTVADYDSFALLCDAYAQYRSASETISKEGATITTANGNIQKHPAVNIAKDAADRWGRMCREFGLTPASRSHVKTTKAGDDDGLDRFIQGAA